MISSKCLGVIISSDVIRYALISRRLNRYRLQGLLAISDWQSKPMADLKKQVAEFLKLHKAGECLSVLAVPRQETVMRQLTLPLDAEANLSKVVEYQLVNLLPAEDAAIAYDYAAQRQEGAPGSLRVSVFLV